jgi:hypothetical protein
MLAENGLERGNRPSLSVEMISSALDASGKGNYLGNHIRWRDRAFVSLLNLPPITA